jgi:hypothetical protein
MLSADAIGNMHTEKQVATVTKRRNFNIKETLLFLTSEHDSWKHFDFNPRTSAGRRLALALAASPEAMCQVDQDSKWLDTPRSSGAEAL